MCYNSIILILIALLLSSCQGKLPALEAPNKKVPVSLSVSPSNIPLLHTSSETKDAINSIHVLIFTGNAGDLQQSPLAYTIKATLEEGDKFVGTFFQSQDAHDLYRLVVLANASDTQITQLSKGSTYARISETLYEDARQRYSPNAPVRMFGVVNRGEGILITKGMSLENISLIRAVARIDIGVGRYNEETGKWDLASSDKYFELTDVEAWSPMNRNFDMPAGEKFSYQANGTPLVNNATGSLEHSATTTVQWKYTDTDILTNGIATYCKDAIYLPEAPLEGYTANQQENRNKRTTLIIGGYLHDPAKPTESATKTWYRLDFTTAARNTPDRDLFDILRNHLYRISLDVRVRGAATAAEAWSVPPLAIGQITMETVPWENGGIVDAPISPRLPIEKQPFHIQILK